MLIVAEWKRTPSEWHLITPKRKRIDAESDLIRARVWRIVAGCTRTPSEWHLITPEWKRIAAESDLICDQGSLIDAIKQPDD